MKYSDFKKKVVDWPIIFSRDVVSRGKSGQAVRNQLERWKKSGRIIRLKKGVFILADDDRRVGLSRPYLANQLYGPSYVSLEYALGYYGLIPERVSDITSVTSLKTMKFANAAGTFIYQHVKLKAYRGFVLVEGDGGLKFFIAEPEKAVVDFLYLNLEKFKVDDPDIFEGSYRFQNTEKLGAKKIFRFADLFENRKLVKVASLFSKYCSLKLGGA